MLLKYNPNNLSLLESIVCFTDILGFSSLIINTLNLQSGNHLLKDLHKTLTKQYALMREMNPYGHFKTFIDNVILAYPIFEDGEGQSGSLFMSFIDYQLEMTLNGYFLRGGIDLGDYYGDDDFAYGPALIEAHDLESSKAIYPRIILSDEMIKMVSQHLGYYGSASYAPQNYVGGNKVAKGLENKSLYDIQVQGELGEFIKVLKVLENYSEVQSINLIQGSLKEFSDTKRFVYLNDGVTERKYVIAEIVLFANKVVSVIEVEREDMALSTLICKLKIQQDKNYCYKQTLRGLVNNNGTWDKKQLSFNEIKFSTLKHGKKEAQHRANLLVNKLIKILRGITC